jgi:hypothetical protein
MRLPNSGPIMVDWDQVEVASPAATQSPSSATSAPTAATISMDICKVSTQVHAHVARPVIVKALDNEEMVDLPGAPHDTSSATTTMVSEVGEDVCPATAGSVAMAPTTCLVECLCKARRPSSNEGFRLSLVWVSPHPPWVTQLVLCETSCQYNLRGLSGILELYSGLSK